MAKMLASIGYTLPEACEGIYLATGQALKPKYFHAALTNNGRLSQPAAAALTLFVMFTKRAQADGRHGKTRRRGGGIGRSGRDAGTERHTERSSAA